MPSDFCDNSTIATEEGTVSALEASIQAKKDNSYYYAHQRKVTGEEPAPPPVHVVLERTPSERTETVESIFNYQFLDEEQVVKVYIPLEGVGAKIGEDSIVTQFDTKAFEVCIRDYKPNRVLKLAIRDLHGEITPAECVAKKLTNKVVLSLKKKPGDEGNYARWSNLKSS